MKLVLHLFALLCYLQFSSASLRSSSQFTSLESQEILYTDIEILSNNLINPISLSKNSFVQLELIVIDPDLLGQGYTQISSASYIQESSDVKESSESESTEVVGDDNAPSQGATDPAITGF